LRFCHT